MDKYNRNYLLLVQKKDGTTLQIKRPFTVEFDIHRNSLSSANVASFRIYNLAPNNRSQIRKDQFDWGDLRTISFAAGYGDNLSLAFGGNISQAWSVREGTNMITQIESYDGGFAYINAVTGQSFPAGTPQSTVIDTLVKSLPGATPGSIGTFVGQISKGNSYNGSTTDILTQITGGGFFIDNGKAHCLNDNECLSGDVPLINAQSGLLGTPVKEATFINFDMLFEPSLRVAQLVNLQSQTAEADFNGTHKVLSLKHTGTISEAVCGNAITTVGLLPGVFVNAANDGTNRDVPTTVVPDE